MYLKLMKLHPGKLEIACKTRNVKFFRGIAKSGLTEKNGVWFRKSFPQSKLSNQYDEANESLLELP